MLEGMLPAGKCATIWLLLVESAANARLPIAIERTELKFCPVSVSVLWA
jgi:hypothetical protein